jgi:hypothetical protein
MFNVTWPALSAPSEMSESGQVSGTDLEAGRAESAAETEAAWAIAELSFHYKTGAVAIVETAAACIPL